MNLGANRKIYYGKFMNLGANRNIYYGKTTKCCDP